MTNTTTDRALDLAKFIAEGSADIATDDIIQVAIEKFGDLNREQFSRGLVIGEEMLNARAAEHHAEADAMRAELARREARDVIAGLVDKTYDSVNDKAAAMRASAARMNITPTILRGLAESADLLVRSCILDIEISDDGDNDDDDGLTLPLGTTKKLVPSMAVTARALRDFAELLEAIGKTEEEKAA
jgi:hypothetical protein